MERSIDSWKLAEKNQLHLMTEGGYITEEQLLDPLALLPLLSSSAGANLTNTVVGFDCAIYRMIHQLTSKAPELQVIPIVGKGGSGKTTLVRQLYNNSIITSSFKTRAWITISESFDIRVSLLGILNCLLIHNKLYTGRSEKELGEDVYEILKHKRYFIVLDDIWNAFAWEELRRFFPGNHNGSRIILTTRKRSWGDYVKSSGFWHEMQPMSDNESWQLILLKVFDGYDKYFPLQLEVVGKKIAHNCEGFPLAVAMAAGFLSKTTRTVDAWKHVESCKFYSTVDKQTQEDSSLKVIADSLSKDCRHLLHLILNEQQPGLQVIPIVGSGKTTLARLLYDRSLSYQKFNTHAWVNCSQHKEVPPLLHDLLDSLREATNEKPYVTDDKKVADHVHKALHKRSFLIVLDDIKDKNTWYLLRKYFQDNKNGSRIILTAREWNSDHEKIEPLKVDPYWEFLIQRAFKQDYRPPELEKAHSKVPELVSTSNKLRGNEFWKLVWQDKSEGESERDLQSDLLSLTYNHLPYHLKPCFLYMGALPEDYEIKASKIINLWIAEGFVRQQRDRQLEDTAEAYLMDLIARNIFSVFQRKQNGKVTAVKIHDVLWKFCTKKAIEENFMLFKDLKGQNVTEDEEHVRRVSVHSLSRDTDLTYLDSARSFLCFGRVSQGTEPTFLNLTWLRVLDVLQYEFLVFPDEMLEQLHLRYLAFSCPSNIPSSIIKFQYLMFIIIAKALSLPDELWEMATLRPIECKETWEWGSCINIYEDLQSNVLVAIINDVVLFYV